MKIHNKNILIIGAIIVVLDQISKYALEEILKKTSITLIPNILKLTLVYNKGAGFGILQGQRLFFIIFSFLVLGAIIYKWKKIPAKNKVIIPMGLLIGGLIGNLIDRIIHGYVIDFIDLGFWPVFNIADSAITIAVVWLVIVLWKE